MASSLLSIGKAIFYSATRKRSLQFIAAVASLLLGHSEARATHAMGGELTYAYLGSNQYRVTLNFYRDCNGVAAPTNCNNGLSFNVTSTACGANFNDCLTLQSVQIITPICGTEIDRCQSASGTYGIEKYTYSKVINLSSWANCGTDWVISWSLCCRNNAVTSLTNPGNQSLYLNTLLNNTLVPKNNSAVFTNNPTPFYCLGQTISYNPGATDADGDSLAYALINARGAGGVNLTYAGGYSVSQPIHNSGGANAVQIDPLTGTVTCVPDIQQVAVVTYRVREYRNGVQVGAVTRDVQFVVRTCPGNTSPTASGINGTNNYQTSVCAGTPITFTINSDDVNGNQVTMAWNNGIPGATFTVGGGLEPTGTFSWTPTIADIGNNVFTVTVVDNACPLTGSSNTGISVVVTPPFTFASAGSDLQACNGVITLQALHPYPQAPGTWTVVSGSGSFSDPANPNAFVTGLAPGTNVFQWTVNYQTCGVSTDQVTVINFSNSQAAANAGPDQTFCGVTSATMAGNTAVSPAVGTWSLISGSGTITSPNAPNTGVTGLGIGQNRFRWSINNGPCGGTTIDDVFITVYNSALPAANAGPDQSICTPANSVTMNASAVPVPASGQWSVVSGSGGFMNSNSPTTQVVGIPVGVHVYRWTVNNGPCGTTTDDVVVTVYNASSPNASAGADQNVCVSTATLTGNTPTAPASGVWSLLAGQGTITNPNSPGTGVTALGIGANIFIWTVNNGPCANGVTTDQVTITRFDPAAPVANAGPDQSLCSNGNSTTMAGNVPTPPSSGTWQLVSGSGTIATPNSPTSAITGLGIGLNVFRWSINNGPCGPATTDLVTIAVYNENQPVASAGPDQNFCTPTNSATLAGNAPIVPATGTWTLVSGGGTITNASSATTTVTALPVGTNVFRWTINNGACANPITFDEVAITIYNNGSASAAAGADQSLCSSNNSTLLAGNTPVSPTVGTWTLVSGGGTIGNPNASNSAVSGLPVGANVFQWSVNNGPCGTTTDQVTVFVFDEDNPVAAAGADQSWCTPIASVSLVGSSLTFPATGVWTVTSGSGTITTPNNPSTTVTALGIGANTFRWTVSNGPCGSGSTFDEVTIFIYNSAAPAASAGADQNLCNATTTTLTGNTPVGVATGSWALISGSGTPTTPSSPTTAITGLAVGANVFEWTISNGPCGATGDQVTIFVFSNTNPVANAGPDQDLCTPVTSSTLAGSNVIFPATGAWTLVSGSGTVTTPNAPNSTVSGLGIGANVFQWTVNNGPCGSPTNDQVTIFLFDNNAQQADAGADQQLCSTNASTTLVGNALVGSATGTWTLTGGSGTIASPNSASTTVSNCGVGVNQFTWTINNGSCGNSSDVMTVTVFDNTNPVANAGADQDLCTPNTSTTLAGSALLGPATGQWQVISGSGIIANATSPNASVSGLAVGANVLQWTVSNGPCGAPTSDVMTVFVFDANNATANAGPDQELCTPSSITNLAGSALTFPATGLWTRTGGGGTIVTPTSPTSQVIGLPIGVNEFTWTVSNGPCGAATVDVMTITVYDQNNAAANAGLDREICVPTFPNNIALNATPPTAPAQGTWTLIQGTGTFVDDNDPTTVVNDLSVGENIFQWTVDNGPCANPVTFDQVSVFVFDAANPLANAGPDQNLCTPISSTVLQGSSLIFPADGLWTLVSGSGVLADPTDHNSQVTGLALGANVFQWTVSNGPCANPITSDLVTINVFNGSAQPANAGPDQSICSDVNAITLAGNAPIGLATGFWNVQQGSAVFANATSFNTTATGLSIGTNVLVWHIDNGACGISSDPVTILVYDDGQSAANAGPDQFLCSPTSVTTLDASGTTFPGQGTWALVFGTGVFTDPNDPNTTVTGLDVGENVFRWTVDNGPCSPGVTTDQVTIWVYDSTTPIANAGPDRFLCAPLSSANMQGSDVIFPGIGTWTLVSGGGTINLINSPTTLISNMPVGVNVFMWTVNNGPCANPITSDLVTITVYDGSNPVAGTGPDQELCTPNTSTSLTGTPIIFPATGVWTLVSGGGTIADPANPSTVVSDLPVGANVFQWTVDNGVCAPGISSAQITVLVYDENNAPANAGSDQNLCTPVTSTSLSGSSVIFPASGEWTLVVGTATITDPADPNTTVTGLGVGEIILQWTVVNGPCANGVTSDLVTINLYDGNAQAADAGPDQDLCSDNASATMAANAPVGVAVGSWTVLQGAATFTDPNSSNTAVTGLAVGENILVWTIDNGSCGISSDLVSVFVYDAGNANANAGADQNLCTPTTSTVLQGSAATFPAVGTWTLVSGAGVISDVNDPGAQVQGLGIGENIFQWTVDNGPCANGITTDQVSIFLFDLNAAPADAGPDQEICTPTSSVSLAGSAPVGSAIGTWTILNGSGTFSDLNDPNATISGLVVGSTVCMWTMDNGPCGSSNDVMTILVYDVTNALANAGPDQELCTPSTSTTLAGSSVIFPAVGTWNLVSGTGVIADVNDPNSSVSGLSVGENVFEWTVNNGPCASGVTTDLVSIFIFDANNASADAGADQQLCTPLTSTTLAGNTPTFPASGQWTVSQGTGVFADATDPNTTVSGLTVGENIFIWTTSNGPCTNGTTSDLVSIFLFDENQLPADAGPDQELCTPTFSATLGGSAVIFPGQGTWTVIQGAGTFADASDPNTSVSGLTIGENIFLWSVTNGPCANPLTSDAVSIFLFDENQLPANAGPDQELCTPNVNSTFEGSALTFPATGQWVLVQGAGSITDPTDPNSTVSDLGLGENIFQWTVSNGPCVNPITSDLVSIFLFDETNANADAGVDQEFCSPVSSTTLAGSSVTFPAVGTWSLISGTGTIVDVNDPNTAVTGLTIGENIFEWSVSNGPCGNAATTDQVSIFIFDDGNPDANAGSDQAFCTPTNSTSLDGSPVTFPAIGTWTLVSGTATITNVNDPNSTLFDLVVGEVVLAWTVDNGPCANGTTSDTLSILIYDELNPIAAAGPDQELCTPTTSASLAGSAVTFPATGAWSILQGTGTFADANDPATTVSAIGVGVNLYVWTVNNGPCANGLTTDTVRITLYNDAMPPADAGADQELCTPNTSTTMAGSAVIFPGVGEWLLLSGTATIVDVTDPNTAITGLTVGVHVFQWTVNNGPCAAPTSDQVTITVFDDTNPIANAGADQSVCTPVTSTTLAGSLVIAPATGTWSLISGQGTITDPADPNTTVTDLGIGPNVFEWSVSNGPCANGATNDQVTILLFDLNAPPADAGADQEQCTPNTSTVLTGNTPTIPAIGVWAVVQGNAVIGDVNDPSSPVSGLIVGENILTWTIDNGVCGISTDSVSLFIFDEFNPAADAGLDVAICTPQDSIYLAGNTPTFPAIGTWSLIEGAGLFEDVNDPDSKVVGLSIGYNTFVWTVDNGPCNNPITTDTMTVILFSDSTAAADAGPDLSICLPLTAVNLQAVPPVLPATGLWSLVSGTGTIVDPSDPATLVTGFGVGISTFVFTHDNGPCPNNGVLTDTMTVSIYDPQAPPADAGPDIEICTPNSSVTLAGNVPLFPATGWWTLVSGTATIADTTDPSSAVTGLPIGEHVFVWTIFNGDCGLGPNFTFDTMMVHVYDATAPASDAGPDQDLCSPATSAVMAGNTPVFPAYGVWSIVSGTGTIADPSDPLTLVNGLVVGEVVLQWTVYNGPCPNGNTSDQVVIDLFDDNAPSADAGPDQEICVPTAPNAVFMAANLATFPAVGTWTLVSGTGTIVDANSNVTEITGLAVGVNTFAWTIDNGPCPGAITTDEVSIIVFNAASPNANAGPDQNLCTPESSTTLAGNLPTFPATGAWTIVSGSGTLSDPADPSSSVTGLGVGQTVLVWTLNNGPCPNGITTDTLVVNVFDSAADAAAAGPDQEFCDDDPVTTTMLANASVFPAIGTWVLISGSATIANASDPFTTITDLGLGENVFEWSIDNGDCGTTTDQVSIFLYDHTVPPADAGAGQFFCENAFTETNLAAVPTTSTGSGAWFQWVEDVWQPVGTDPDQLITTGLGLGANIFQWTVSNGPCGSTVDTMVVFFNDCISLTIPDAFSPNGDGVNDTYVITNLEAFPENTLLVFNRWGSKVLERHGYANDWDGRSENSLNWGEELPESTYYYILDLGDGSDKYSGYIYLKR